MSFAHPESESRFPRTSIINLQDHCSTKIMDVRGRKIAANPQSSASSAAAAVVRAPYRGENKKMEYHPKTLSSLGSGKRLLPSSYFSLESLLLLICLTASLLILPLILPPLPPPPFMLLLLPIGILAVLMVLAFMPSNARDITYTYV